MKIFQLHKDSILLLFDQIKQGHFLWFFLPGLIASLLFTSLYTLASEAENLFSILENIPLIGSILAIGISKTFGLIYFLIMQIYIFFVLTILSPFNTVLSESLDAKLTGKKYKMDFEQVVKDFLRMILVVLIAIIMEFFIMGLYWILSWIFGLGFLDSIVFGLISAFFFGFSFYDYSLERYNQGVFASLGFAFSNMGLVTLTGVIFILIFSIPFIGIALAPVLITMLSTIIYLKKYKYIH